MKTGAPGEARNSNLLLRERQYLGTLLFYAPKDIPISDLCNLHEPNINREGDQNQNQVPQGRVFS